MLAVPGLDTVQDSAESIKRGKFSSIPYDKELPFQSTSDSFNTPNERGTGFYRRAFYNFRLRSSRVPQVGGGQQGQCFSNICAQATQEVLHAMAHSERWWPHEPTPRCL